MPSSIASHAVDVSPVMRRKSSLGYQVNHLARLLEAALRIRITPHGVAPGQFAQLLALYEQDGVSQVELCEAVKIEQSTMAHTLRRMERDDLVARLRSERDRRRTEIWLTEHARTLEPTLVACAVDTNEVATKGISASDLTVTNRVLAQMIHNLELHDEGTA